MVRASLESALVRGPCYLLAESLADLGLVLTKPARVRTSARAPVRHKLDKSGTGAGGRVNPLADPFVARPGVTRLQYSPRPKTMLTANRSPTGGSGLYAGAEGQARTQKAFPPATGGRRCPCFLSVLAACHGASAGCGLVSAPRARARCSGRGERGAGIPAKEALWLGPSCRHVTPLGSAC